MSKVKYMGTADEVAIAKGDDLGGRLAEGIPQEIRFNASNNWVVDVDDSDVRSILLEDGDRFKDVSSLKRIPSNEHQKTFLGHRSSESAEEPSEVSESGNAGGSSATGAGGTTTGGSTRRGGGGGGAAGTRAGGST